MIKKFYLPRGTSDILPEQIPLWENLENKARALLKIYGYKEIRTPIFEDTGLFKRSLGQTSAVVNKQLLELASQQKEDKTESSDVHSHYALRPEGTAAVVRSYIENSFPAESLTKLFYIGPMFRGERPQKGRLRQFHQIGVEAIGAQTASPYLDAEVIALTVNLLKKIGVPDFELQVNTIGTPEDKENFSKLLRAEFKERLSDFCSDCQSRFERNVFRVLDCKNKSCQTLIDSFHFGLDHLSVQSRKYFEEVCSALRDLDIAFKHSPKLVRGLDYYTHTVFEVVGKTLGSQDALGAGGRYNSLVSDLGGPQVDAVGFALGMERILLAVSSNEQPAAAALDAFVIGLDDAALKHAFILLNKLREHEVKADMGYKASSLKSQMRQANKTQARFVFILGEDEIKSNKVTVKNMSSGEQSQEPLTEIKSLIKRIKS